MKKFLLGAAFTLVLYPLLDDIAAIINQGTQHLNTCIAVQTAKKTKKLADIQGEEREKDVYNQTQAIGFEIPSEDYYYYDED